VQVKSEYLEYFLSPSAIISVVSGRRRCSRCKGALLFERRVDWTCLSAAASRHVDFIPGYRRMTGAAAAAAAAVFVQYS